MIQETSLEAYKEVPIHTQQELVYNTLKVLGEATDRMLSIKIGMAINVVVPRRNELVKQGLIIESYKDFCPISGKRVIFWRCIK